LGRRKIYEDKMSLIDREKYAAEIMRDTHKLLMEALRQREQEIIRFLAILGPAMAGYIWLIRAINSYKISQETFLIGAGGVIFTLFIGAWYAITLGYNFRYIIFYLSRIENDRVFDQYIPLKWPRRFYQFKESSLICSRIPYCAPPEIIKVFWHAFNFMIIGILLSVFMVENINISGKKMIALLGAIGAFISYAILPIYYGCKIHGVYDGQAKTRRYKNSLNWPECLFPNICNCIKVISTIIWPRRSGR